MKHQPYLYKWTHIPTGKWYVGSRTMKGCHPDDGYICSSKYVKPMIIDAPEEWHRDVLCIGPAKYIYDLETKYLRLLDAANDENSFNRCNNKFPYVPMTDDLKKRISQSTKGKKKPPRTKEHCANLSDAHKGKIISSETRKKLSNTLTGWKLKTPRSDEYRSKMSKLHKNKTVSESTRKKISQANRGNTHTEEAKLKISQAQRGITHPLVSCLYCKKEGGVRTMKRWHLDNCRSKS